MEYHAGMAPDRNGQHKAQDQLPSAWSVDSIVTMLPLKSPSRLFDRIRDQVLAWFRENR